MTLVSTVTVGSGGAASIDFNSIPATGTDLMVVLSAKKQGGTQFTKIRFNNDTTVANYTYRRLQGNGSATSSSSGTDGIIGYLIGTDVTAAPTFNSACIYIPNYTSSVPKSFTSDSVNEDNSTEAYQTIFANTWSGTSAISSIKLSNDGGWNFVQYSTASLYTITKGSGGATVS